MPDYLIGIPGAGTQEINKRKTAESLEKKARRTYKWKHALLGLMAMTYGFFPRTLRLPEYQPKRKLAPLS
jgi:hypothetical protein